MTVRPNFLIIGAAKCGTTALASNLAMHPDCCMSEPKETSFFTRRDYDADNGALLAWYAGCFTHYKGEKCVGEATPSYSLLRPEDRTAVRIQRFNPGMKLIFQVRDPMDKQISAWKMYYYAGVNGLVPDQKPVHWALKGFDYWMQRQREAGQWDNCLFHAQVNAYRSRFPVENMCISFLEDWKPDKAVEIARIMRFLGLDPGKWNDTAKVRENMAANRRMDRPFLKRVRTSRVGRWLVSAFPKSWRDYSRRHIASKPFQYNDAHLALREETRREFVEFVRDDARQFLQLYGKDPGFWKSLTLA